MAEVLPATSVVRAAAGAASVATYSLRGTGGSGGGLHRRGGLGRCGGSRRRGRRPRRLSSRGAGRVRPVAPAGSTTAGHPGPAASTTPTAPAATTARSSLLELCDLSVGDEERLAQLVQVGLLGRYLLGEGRGAGLGRGRLTAFLPQRCQALEPTSRRSDRGAPIGVACSRRPQGSDEKGRPYDRVVRRGRGDGPGPFGANGASDPPSDRIAPRGWRCFGSGWVECR
jgi:hypothetical protein